MILFVLFILLLIYSGLMLLNLFEKEIKISHIICFAFPIGVAIHTLLFSFFVYLRIDYNIIIFTIVSLLLTLSLLKKRPILENDIKDIPIYLIIILVLLSVRLIWFSVTGFVDFYNFDEFSAYQRNSYILEFYKDFYGFFSTYSPVNIFLGSKTFETLGFEISAVRGFSPIFFVLTSLFIYLSLKERNVNKNISALVAILFLVSSSELLVLSKTFYNNIYFMYYFTVSIYLILKHYHIDNKKGIPFIGLLLFIGFLLTRKDALLVGVIFILFYMFINLIKKRIKIRQFILIASFFIFMILSFKIADNYNVKLHNQNIDKVNTFLMNSSLDNYQEKLQITNIKKFVKSLYLQTFGFELYTFNWIAFLVFGATTFVGIIMIFKKNLFKEYRKIMFWTKFIQFAYMGLVMLTEIFVFSVYEFTLAASFSRYILGTIPIDFILLAMLLFGNNTIISDEFKKKHKIFYYALLFLLFSLIPIFIEKFIFIKESFSIIRFGITFIICEFIGFAAIKKD